MGDDSEDDIDPAAPARKGHLELDGDVLGKRRAPGVHGEWLRLPGDGIGVPPAPCVACRVPHLGRHGGNHDMLVLRDEPAALKAPSAVHGAVLVRCSRFQT